MRELCYSEGAIARAVQAGRLHPVFRGAFAVGYAARSPHRLCMAAIQSCGAGALLSHFTSAWLWGLGAPGPVRPEVTVPTRGHRRAGLVIHHSTILDAEDRAEIEDLPTTSVARTLLDLAGIRRGRHLPGTIDRARRRGLLDIASIDALLVRAGGHRGRGPLLRTIEIYREQVSDRARSELLLLALVKEAGLPRPAINLFVAGHEVDAYWEDERFAIEVDGWENHRTREAFERDPLRIEDLKLAGIDAIRITARRIETKPDEVAARLQHHLARRRAELGR
ncbi:MAG: hypothetical protein JJE35_12550 [Thermoleophilia bacterium]|nr:hypothetical protein [Thermoleophilia bacterium]